MFSFRPRGDRGKRKSKNETGSVRFNTPPAVPPHHPTSSHLVPLPKRTDERKKKKGFVGFRSAFFRPDWCAARVFKYAFVTRRLSLFRCRLSVTTTTVTRVKRDLHQSSRPSRACRPEARVGRSYLCRRGAKRGPATNSNAKYSSPQPYTYPIELFGDNTLKYARENWGARALSRRIRDDSSRGRFLSFCFAATSVRNGSTEIVRFFRRSTLTKQRLRMAFCAETIFFVQTFSQCCSWFSLRSENE